MNETEIKWTDLTWNPASGCAKVSAGCKYCYADALAEQKRGTLAFPNGFDLTIRPHKLDEPRRVKAPSLVFVNSMSDLFWDAIPTDYVDRIVEVMRETPRHHYQVLTKRPKRMAEYFATRTVPSNVWVGTTVESAAVLDRVDHLRRIDAETRFLSVEPMLTRLPQLELDGIHWVIVGGESGLHLREPKIRDARSLAEHDGRRWTPRADRIDWVREVRDACYEQGAAFFFKQWGGVRPTSAGDLLDGRVWREFPRLPTGHVLTSGTSRSAA